MHSFIPLFTRAITRLFSSRRLLGPKSISRPFRCRRKVQGFKLGILHGFTRWWFQTCFIFTPILGEQKNINLSSLFFTSPQHIIHRHNLRITFLMDGSPMLGIPFWSSCSYSCSPWLPNFLKGFTRSLLVEGVGCWWTAPYFFWPLMVIETTSRALYIPHKRTPLSDSGEDEGCGLDSKSPRNFSKWLLVWRLNLWEKPLQKFVENDHRSQFVLCVFKHGWKGEHK